MIKDINRCSTVTVETQIEARSGPACGRHAREDGLMSEQHAREKINPKMPAFPVKHRDANNAKGTALPGEEKPKRRAAGLTKNVRPALQVGWGWGIGHACTWVLWRGGRKA